MTFFRLSRCIHGCVGRSSIHQFNAWLKRWSCSGTRKHHTSGLPFLSVHDEVNAAIHDRRPVVALESTIITHGMPYPHNLQTAKEVENVVRQNGALPATVAIIKGKICVGLSDADLEWLASDQCKPSKASRRDLAYLLSKGLTGGTTVSATMIAAHMTGIPIFVTGGVGGVHRGAEHNMDISADLRELGRTPITVVSAGVKSILDIPKTLEYLETEGVGVYSYGPTNDFPAFFTARSGHKAPYSIQTPQEAACVIDVSHSLGLQSGMLIAVPIPEEESANEEQIEKGINIAIREAESKGIAGKDLTPFILDRLNSIMGGDSLKANIALVKNNANVGSQIAVALSELKNSRDRPNQKLHDGHLSQGETHQSNSTSNPVQNQNSTSKDDTRIRKSSQSEKGRIVVVGGTNVDFTVHVGEDNVIANGATYAGNVKQSFGGVGRNLADGLARLHQTPLFLSAMGDDNYPDMLRSDCSHMDLSAVRILPDHKSATYCAILNSSGDLIYGIGDFQVHRQIDADYVSQYEEDLATSPMVFFDGNIPSNTMQHITKICRENDVPVFYEPTDVLLVRKLFETDAWRHLTYTSPNLNELRMLHAGVTTGDLTPPNTSSRVEQSEQDTLDEVLSLARAVVDVIPSVLVTVGRHGVVLCRNTDAGIPLPYGDRHVAINKARKY